MEKKKVKYIGLKDYLKLRKKIRKKREKCRKKLEEMYRIRKYSLFFKLEMPKN